MVTVFNSFLSYLLVVIVFFCVIVAGIFAGKKIRDIKTSKDESDEVEKK